MLIHASLDGGLAMQLCLLQNYCKYDFPTWKLDMNALLSCIYYLET